MLTANQRNTLISHIHIAQKELELDEKTYRAALKLATGKESCGKMNLRELAAARDHFKTLGFKVKPKAAHGKRPQVGEEKAALVGKIEALLADLGLPWTYLTAKTEKSRVKASDKPMSLLERITGKADDGRTVGKERIEFCTVTDLRKIAAALTYHAQRKAKQAEVKP